MLLGGDTVRSPQIVASLTLIGRLGAGITPPQRSHARPGDRLFVTGNPGESGAGLRLELEPVLKERLEPALAAHLRARHFRPTPRLREGHALVRSLPRLALIDVSDGVFNETGLLTEASGPGVGAVIRWDRLPQSPALQQAAPFVGLAPQHLTLFGGEDFELLFACDATLSEVQAIFRAEGSDTLVSEIGMMTAEPGVRVVDALGATIDLDPEIYAHFG
jgi:thiamine-monophosphate kinase